MSEVLIDYSTNVYTDSELVLEVESIETHLQGNPTYATPSPTIIALTGQRIKFQEKVALANNGTPTQTSAKNDERKILEGMLHVEGAYVQLTSGGDETKILSSGMHTAASRSKIGALGVVSDFRVIVPEASNKVVCSCKPMPKASFYEVLFTPSPATSASIWVSETSTSSTIVINNLPSYVPYVFKMAARGTNMTKNFSNPITKAAS